MLKTGFYLPRRNHLKILGPMIAYSCQQPDTEAHVFVIGWKTKAGQEVDLSEIEATYGKAVHINVVETPGALGRKIIELKLSAVFSVSTRLQQIDFSDTRELMTETQSHGTKWLAVPHLAESELQIVYDWPNCHPWDAIGVFSPRAKQFLQETLDKTGNHDDFFRRVFVTGCPEFDDLIPMDKAKSRVDCGLPADGALIIFAPPTLSQSGRFPDQSMRFNERLFRREKHSFAGITNGLKSFFKKENIVPYRDYLAAIRQFADRNDARIVVKVRSKTPKVDALTGFADFIVGDIQFYPFTSRQLLSISDAYFGFYSSMSIEAAVEGLKAVTFEPYPVEPLYSPMEQELKRFFDTEKYGAWNMPDTATFIRGYRLEGPKFLEDLAQKKLSDFRMSEDQKTKYLQRHVHFAGCSSERFNDVLRGDLL